MKDIIVEVDDGMIVGVFCPNESYNVHILDHGDERDKQSVAGQYYSDLEDTKTKLVNCI